MSNRRKTKNTPARPNTRQTSQDRERNAAVYVDELLPIEGRREELINILRSKTLSQQNFRKIIVYGSPQSDVDDAVRDAISLLTEHGLTVEFAA